MNFPAAMMAAAHATYLREATPTEREEGCDSRTHNGSGTRHAAAVAILFDGYTMLACTEACTLRILEDEAAEAWRADAIA